MVTARRQNIRQVSLNRRYGALCARERVRIRQLLRQALALFVAAENQDDEDEASNLRHLGVMIVIEVIRIRRDRTILPPIIRSGTIAIDDISDSEAWTRYRFRKPDLRRLFEAFRFPEERIQMRNGGRYPSESAFLLVIRRLRQAVLDNRWVGVGGNLYTLATPRSTPF